MFFESNRFMSAIHTTVMQREVTALLTREGARGGLLVDATLGEGGHAEALLRQREDIQVVGIDQDEEAIESALGRFRGFGERFRAVSANFREIGAALMGERVDGVVMDLGVSSRQLDSVERGFSFQRDGPLDMRMDRRCDLTAADIVNRWSEEELARIFWELGEERWSRRIARRLAEERRAHAIRTTGELAELVARVAGRSAGGWRTHPATRVFRALRMAVNDELGALEAGLDAVWGCLAGEGRLVVISFHSLEDRIVKRRFREWAVKCGTRNAERGMGSGEDGEGLRLRLGLSGEEKRECGVILNKKPMEPAEEEILGNPRARSAKLRGVEKKAEG